MDVRFSTHIIIYRSKNISNNKVLTAGDYKPLAYQTGDWQPPSGPSKAVRSCLGRPSTWLSRQVLPF